MKVVFKFIAWVVGVMIGITASAIAIEATTGGHNAFFQGIFGLIGGAIGWILVGKKSTNDSEQ